MTSFSTWPHFKSKSFGNFKVYHDHDDDKPLVKVNGLILDTSIPYKMCFFAKKYFFKTGNQNFWQTTADWKMTSQKRIKLTFS